MNNAGMSIEGPLPHPHWSYSKWRVLDECPMYFYRTHVLGERFPMLVVMAVGSVLHYMAKRFFEVYYQSEESFANAATHLWLEVVEGNESAGGYNKPIQPIAWKNQEADKWDWYHRLDRLCRGFYRRHADHRGLTVAIGREVDFTVPNWRGIELAGKIDRVDRVDIEPGRGLHIVDYKMGMATPDSLQAAFYQVGYEERLRRELFNDLPLLSIRIENLYSGMAYPLLIRDRHGLDRFHLTLIEASNYEHYIHYGEMLPPPYQNLPIRHLPTDRNGAPVLWSRSAGVCERCPFAPWCQFMMNERSASQNLPDPVKIWVRHEESLRRERMAAQEEIPLVLEPQRPCRRRPKSA